jgi:DnaJ-class molecular chaperone
MARKSKVNTFLADADTACRHIFGKRLQTVILDGVQFLSSTKQAEKADPLKGEYELLEVSPNCSDKFLRAAYRHKVKETHPDTGGSPEAFKKVDDAMDKICQARGIKK